MEAIKLTNKKNEEIFINLNKVKFFGIIYFRLVGLLDSKSLCCVMTA